ncbi:MAG: hypothetical protein Q8K58_11895 [Acidimicrobiales bacterium]|nr:hypothetical protein [Acidimicrobiales bacterium]
MSPVEPAHGLALRGRDEASNVTMSSDRLSMVHHIGFLLGATQRMVPFGIPEGGS